MWRVTFVGRDDCFFGLLFYYCIVAFDLIVTRFLEG